MAGAMRKMGIYLGLVEDDDARTYGRYDTRQGEYPERNDDRRYGRYADEDGYADDSYGEPPYAGDGYADDRYAGAGQRDRYDSYADLDDDLPLAPDPEPAVLRRAGSPRSLGLAPVPSGATAVSSGPRPAGGATGAGATAGAGTGSAGSSGPSAGPAGLASSAGALGLAVRETPAPAPVAKPEPAAKQPYRITTLHPRTYNEARQIGEAFRDGSPVIMNLTELDHADARRLVDFAAGLIFGLRGSIEPVTNKVFLLSPRDVDVTAEDKARIREGGFLNQS